MSNHRIQPLFFGLLLGVMATNADDHKRVVDFAAHGSSEGWRVVNDSVMGGVSDSSFRAKGNTGVFTGNVSLANNGGFASVRSPVKMWLAPAAQALILRVKGDGKRYKMALRTQDDFSSASYQISFATRDGEWQEVRLPLKDFEPTFRGRKLRGLPQIKAESVRSLGFLISDKQAGPFRFEIQNIKSEGQGDTKLRALIPD